jgi:hypothetical protein
VKKSAIAFGIFFVLLVAGLTTCVPGVCGCAFSWLPDNWEQYYALPGVVADFLGLLGCAVSGFMLLVLWTRRQTIKSGQATLARKDRAE